MRMSIDDSERHLRLMLGGMKYAVEYWKDKDKEESDIEQTNVEAVKTALDTMRKYKKIEELAEYHMLRFIPKERMNGFQKDILEVIEDGNVD